MSTERQPLVGRGPELALLTRALDSVTEHHRAAVAVVAGDPGMGKTRLLTELVSAAQSHRLGVLTGSASEFERGLPFGVFVDALDDHVRSLPDRTIGQLGPESLEELALVFPSLRVAPPEEETARVPDGRVHAYFALRTLLEHSSDDRGLVLVLDDLHWADRASLELLAHLIRRPPRGPVLIACAYRPTQADPDLIASVARAASDRTAAYVELAPLGLEDSGRLVRGSASERARLHRLSGGNPFYLLELARSGTPGDALNGLVEAAGVPPAVARAIVQELSPLTDAARALVMAGAVAGDPFELDLAVAASGLSEATALTALDELAGHGLVRPTEVPRRFTFRHPLVRHAVYGAVPPGQRLATHERCAQVLGEQGAVPAARAHHVEQAARPGDAQAVGVLASAAAEASARAPSSAVRWLRAGLRLLPADADPQRRLELLSPLPGLLASLGDLDGARTSLLEAISLVPGTDAAQRVQLATACAAVEQLLGRHDEAHRRLVSTLDSLPSGAGREAVAVMVALVMDSFYQRDPAALRRWGLAAVERAGPLEDRALVAASTSVCALACALTGDTAEAESHRAATLALLGDLTDEELAGRLDVLGNLACAELYLDHYADSAAHAQRGLTIGRATGTLSSAPTLIPSLGTSLWVLGRLEESLGLLDEAVESGRAMRDEQALAWRLFNLGLAQAVAGETRAALRSSEESLALATRLGDSVIATMAGATVALALCESGEPGPALETLHRTGGGEELPYLPGGWRAHFLEVATRCLLELDRADEAETAADRAGLVAQDVGLPYARSMAERAAAACALHRGDHGRAATHALAAVAEAERIGARLDAARARILAGRALAAAGSHDAAVAELRSAAAIFDASGVSRFRDEAERELGRLGQRPHRRTPRGEGHGVTALTRREREVADLVVRRHTNPQIAELLFLSPKTVEAHLSNIFRKLDVSSRADVARAIEAHHATPSP